jgi:hypothetical protein
MDEQEEDCGGGGICGKDDKNAYKDEGEASFLFVSRTEARAC